MPSQKPEPKPEPKPPREQEQSIKARKTELFEEHSATAAGPVKPFPQYLAETPAAPLSKVEKRALWAVAALAVLLLLAAFATIRPQKKRIVYKSRTPAAAQPATPAESKSTATEPAKTAATEAKAAAPEASKAAPK
jgi:hypothetical protein